MSVQSPTTAPLTRGAAPNPSELVEQTRVFADQTYKAVASAYLAFRRDYYHEANPSLSTLPQAHAEIRKSELALLVESTLRLTPQAIKSIPLVGGFLKHLQRVADMHSISEDERTALHNLTIGFLRGIRGGIQPWYVEWLLTSAHNLNQVTNLDYYLEFPFDGLLYHDPTALTAFDSAARRGDIKALQGEIERLAARLIEVLRDPVRTQPLLAFTGPDGNHRRFVFDLKTAAGLALVAYMIAVEVRLLTHPQQAAPPHSALAPLPTQLKAQVVNE
jgi:hypothetical protein